jgi:hypothetical protein
VEATAWIVNILAYTNFTADLCGSTLWLSIITTVLMLILPLVQLLHFNPQNSLLTTALVTLLVSYLSFSAQEYFLTGCTTRLTLPAYIIDLIVSLALFVITPYGTVMGGFSEN